jgi:translation elongation factor EF-4
MDAGLEIIPVLNKIDLPGAEPDKRAQEIHDLIGTKPDEILRISAKEGRGVPELLEAVVHRVPPPRGNPEAPLRALIFDSYYDRYRGAIPSIRVVDGMLQPGMKIAFGAHRDDVYEVDEVGYLQLGHKPAEQLEAGEVGYVVGLARIRNESLGDPCTALTGTRITVARITSRLSWRNAGIETRKIDRDDGTPPMVRFASRGGVGGSNTKLSNRFTTSLLVCTTLSAVVETVSGIV